MFYLLVVDFLHTPLSFSHFYPRYQQNILYTKNADFHTYILSSHVCQILLTNFCLSNIPLFQKHYTLAQKQYGTYNSNSYVINCLCSKKPPVISAVGKPAVILSQEVLYLKLKHSRSPCIAGGLFVYIQEKSARIFSGGYFCFIKSAIICFP